MICKRAEEKRSSSDEIVPPIQNQQMKKLNLTTCDQSGAPFT